MKKHNLLLILVSILMILFITGCANSKLKKYSKYITKSMNDVVSIDINVEATDQNVLVYKYLRDIKLTDNKAEFQTTISTLSSNFILEDKVSSETVENIDRSKLNTINLNKELLDEFSIKSGVLEAKINANNLSKVLGSNSLEIEGKANLKITYEKKKIVKLECDFKTKSTKDVIININYNY